jgi:hypothetical protein
MKMNTYKAPAKALQDGLHILCMGIFLSLILFFPSCTNEEGEDTARPVLTGESEVVLSLRLPGASSPATRSVEEYEDLVSSVDVLVFDDDGGYLYTAAAYDITPGTTPDPPSPIAAVKNFGVKLKQTGSGETVDLWVVANAHYLPGIEEGTSKADVAKLLVVDFNDNTDEVALELLLPMWGTLTNVEILNSSTLGGNNTVNLIRMFARIDVAVASSVTNFELTCVWYCNFNRIGRIVPGAISNDGTWTAPPNLTYVTEPSLLPDMPKMPFQEFTNVTDNAITAMIYPLETEKGDGYDGTDDVPYEEEPCLLIAGRYGGSMTESWYRVDFVQTKDNELQYLDILRNHLYVVSITNVSGPGLSGVLEMDDLLAPRPVNITANTAVWDISDMKYVVIDDRYMLSVSCDSVVFTQNGMTKDIQVYTDCETGWAIDQNDPIPDWITAHTDPLSEIISGEKKIMTTLSLTATSFEYGRVGYFTITAGGLTQQIKVIQGVNLVWVSSSTTAKIPRAGGDPVRAIDGAPLTMAFAGTYEGEFQVHAHAGTSTFTCSSDDKSAHPVAVGANNNDSWNERTITYSYSGAGIPETAIPVTGSQLGYWISSTNTTLSYMGGTCSINIDGDFPEGTKIDVMDGETVVSGDITAKSGVTELTITQKNTSYTAIRTYTVYARDDARSYNNALCTITQEVCPPNLFFYIDKRYAFFKINEVGGTGAGNGAISMTIDQEYNTRDSIGNYEYLIEDDFTDDFRTVVGGIVYANRGTITDFNNQCALGWTSIDQTWIITSPNYMVVRPSVSPSGSDFVLFVAGNVNDPDTKYKSYRIATIGISRQQFVFDVLYDLSWNGRPGDMIDRADQDTTAHPKIYVIIKLDED